MRLYLVVMIIIGILAAIIVPKFAGHDSIAAMARAMDVDRSALTLMLGVVGTKPATKLRELAEDHMTLTRGGMTEVLSQLVEL